MTTTTGFARDRGWFPVEPSGEAPPIRSTIFENDRFPNGQPSFRRQATRAISRFLITFCSSVAASLAWRYQQQLNTSLNAMRQSVDRLVAAHQQILRSIGQIATSTAADQKQMAGSIDQTDADSAPPAKVSGITVEGRTTGVRPLQTLSERGKQFSAVSWGHDASCFPCASAVLQNHPGGWSTRTLRAPGSRGHHALVRRRATLGKRPSLAPSAAITRKLRLYAARVSAGRGAAKAGEPGTTWTWGAFGCPA
jgi:hypothetical protein